MKYLRSVRILLAFTCLSLPQFASAYSESWTESAPVKFTVTSPGILDLNGIVFANGQFVAVGSNGTILAANDTMTVAGPVLGNFTQIHVSKPITQSGDYKADLTAIAANNDGVLVTVGKAGAVAYSSMAPSGPVAAISGVVTKDAWKTSSANLTADLRGIASDGTQFVAVGTNNTIVSSLTGENWTPQSSGFSPAASISINFAKVSWTGDQFLLVGTYTGPLNPITGQKLPPGSPRSQTVTATSTDGKTWTPQLTGFTSTVYCTAGVGIVTNDAGANLLVVVGSNGTAGFAATSTDGKMWTPAALNAKGAPPVPPLNAVAFQIAENDSPVPRSIVAVGNKGTFISSIDGITWNFGEGTTGQGSTNNLFGVASDGNLVVVVGAKGTIFTATPHLQADTPVVTTAPVSGGIGQLVTLTSATDGGSIYFTLDGSTPTTASTLYTGPFVLLQKATIRARLYVVDGTILLEAISAPVAVKATTPPAFTVTVSDAVIAAGRGVTFTATVSSPAPSPGSPSGSEGLEKITYQWLFNGKPIPGATQANLTIAATTTINTGKYSVQVGIASVALATQMLNVTSNAVPLTVLKTAVLPQILTQPKSLSVKSGGTAKFTVKVTGTSPFKYQWQKHGVPIPPSSPLGGLEFSGQTTSTLTINKVMKTDADTYNVVISNPQGQVTSATLVFEVLPGQD